LDILAEVHFGEFPCLSLGKLMTFTTKYRRIMVLSVAVAPEARFACSHLPRMGRVTGGTSGVDMGARPVQASKGPMTGGAACQRLHFPFFEMASAAVARHHGGRFGKLVTGDAADRRRVACPVAEVAEDLAVFAV
jgi:hypothetical protein